MDKEGKQHGFLLTGDQFATVDYPGALSTWAYSVNSAGDIVGYHIDTAGLPGGGYRAFLLRGGSFSDVNYPGHMNTMSVRITDEGVILGCYHDTDTMGTMHGMVFKDGAFQRPQLAGVNEQRRQPRWHPRGRTVFRYDDRTLTQLPSQQ